MGIRTNLSPPKSFYMFRNKQTNKNYKEKMNTFRMRVGDLKQRHIPGGAEVRTAFHPFPFRRKGFILLCPEGKGGGSEFVLLWTGTAFTHAEGSESEIFCRCCCIFTCSSVADKEP